MGKRKHKGERERETRGGQPESGQVSKEEEQLVSEKNAKGGVSAHRHRKSTQK